MSDTPWTPGPWTLAVVTEDDASWFEVRGAVDCGGWMTVIADMVEHTADARLIAAAPDMAEALEWYADQMCEGFCDDFPQAWTYHASMDEKCAGCKARAALAKAKGATT